VAQAHYERHRRLFADRFYRNLKKISVPVLVMHSEDDQLVPYVARRTAVGEAFEKRHAENLQGFPARDDPTQADHDQRDCWRSSSEVEQSGCCRVGIGDRKLKEVEKWDTK